MLLYSSLREILVDSREHGREKNARKHHIRMYFL